MKGIFERTEYPSKRNIKWLRRNLTEITEALVCKGYSKDEAQSLAWNVVEDIDLRKVDDVQGAIKRTLAEILPKGDHAVTRQAEEEMLDENEESFMDFELSNGLATREDYGLATVGGA